MPEYSSAESTAGERQLSVSRRLHELDGLRAVAILLVLFHHSLTSTVQSALGRVGLPWLGEYVSYVTRSGVELFFVLSAVVLLGPYLRRERSFGVRRFFVRRIQRLWPPYLFALGFAAFVVYFAGLHPTWYSSEIVPAFHVRELTYQAGIINFGWRTYNGAWWSLTPEIAFYVSLPLLVIVCARTRVETTIRVLLVVTAAASVAVSAGMSPGVSSPSGVAELCIVYFPCFIVGASIAVHLIRPFLGFVMVGGGAIYSVAAVIYPGLNPHLGFAFFYAGVVVVAVNGAGRLKTILASYPLVWLGERSYSLFLVHFSVFYLVNYVCSLLLPGRTLIYLLLTRVVGLPLALLVATLLFFAVERRFARGLATAHDIIPNSMTVVPETSHDDSSALRPR